MVLSSVHIGFSVNGLIAGLGGILIVLEMFPIVVSVSIWTSDLHVPVSK